MPIKTKTNEIISDIPQITVIPMTFPVLKIKPENVPTIKQIRSLLTDASRITGQLRMSEKGDEPKMKSLQARLLHYESVMDQIRKDLFDLE